MLTPALDPVFFAYNIGSDGGILRTICIVRKYFRQHPDPNDHFGSFPVKNYSREPFRGWFRVNFCRRAAGTPIHKHACRNILPMILIKQYLLATRKAASERGLGLIAKTAVFATTLGG